MKEKPWNLQLILISIVRLILTTGLRMAYPFLPEIARGLNVSTETVSRLISFRALAGFLSPLFGPLSEALGRKAIMLLGIALFSMISLLVALFPSIWTLGIALFLIGLSKAIFDPAMQSYLGDRVPYRKRGWAVAVTEFSWSGSLLLGAPFVGLLIQLQGWSSPFLALSVLGFAFTFILGLAIPQIKGGTIGETPKFARVLKENPVIFSAAVFATLTLFANEAIMIVYGVWMESSFNLSITGLGLTAGLIGGGELLGELTAGLAVDRFGKRRVIIIFSALTALIYLLIPLISRSLWSALLSLFLLFYSFETTIVAVIPLFTELVPQARSVMMSVSVASQSMGRALGALLGPSIYAWKGFGLSGILAFIFMFLALAIFALKVKESRPRPQAGELRV
ncbi:MAG: MFS transporter [Caldiserica bacterium]|jgi:predicted MFS family arabinose efflux permease|nr:MFS transporter [Caldisericota bacterium]